MKWAPKKIIVAGFGSAFVVLLIIGVVFYKSQLKYIETSNVVIKTQTILKKLELVLSMVTDAETGQRGYIITGDERYLEPYRVAIAEIHKEVKDLRELIRDNPIQKNRLDALEPLIAEKLRGLEERINLRKNRGFEVAAREVRSGKGRIVMNEIRGIIAEMENDERKLLRQWMAEAKTNAQRTIFIIIFGSSLAFALVGLATFITYRGLTERKLMEEELLKAYAEMEQKVKERTAELHKINESLQKEIAERKHMEEKLKTASEEWRATFDSTTDIIMLLSSEMKIIKANLSTKKFLNRPFNEILGKNCFQLFHGTDRPPATCPLEKMKVTKKHEEAELYLSEKDIWIRVSVDPIFDNKGNLIRSVHIIRDITGRKRAEEELCIYQEQLRSLASQFLLIEEQERRRIATDLHNHISQTLAISKIRLGALRESIPSSGLAEYVDEIRDLIEQMIQYTRSLTFELSPPILYELGFEAAVEWLGEEVLKEHGILFHFKNDEQPKPLDDEARILLFQTVRELMTNIVKHAQAREAKVSIQKVGDDIRINIEDDGVGFDASEIDSYLKTIGFGLFSIRERLKYMKGYIEVKSEIGHGTKVTITVPLKLESESA